MTDHVADSCQVHPLFGETREGGLLQGCRYTLTDALVTGGGSRPVDRRGRSVSLDDRPAGSLARRNIGDRIAAAAVRGEVQTDRPIFGVRAPSLKVEGALTAALRQAY